MASTLSIRCDDFLRLTQEVSELSHTHSAPVTPVGIGGTSHVSELHGTACTVCSHVPIYYINGTLYLCAFVEWLFRDLASIFLIQCYDFLNA